MYPDARNPFTFTELIDGGLEPWAVPEVWMMGGPNPDDRPSTSPPNSIARSPRCVATLSQHTDPDAMADRVRAWLPANVSSYGLPAGSSAEAFQVIDTA